MEDNQYTTIDEYISVCPAEIQDELKTLRKVIKEAAPDAQEKISWQKPTFALHGNLVHFAAHKNHIGFYPGAEGIEAFKEELTGYKNSKGAVQFPNGKPLPYDIISRIVKYRVEENKKAAESKQKKKI